MSVPVATISGSSAAARPGHHPGPDDHDAVRGGRLRAGEETVPRIAVAIEAAREVSQTWLTSRGQSEP